MQPNVLRDKPLGASLCAQASAEAMQLMSRMLVKDEVTRLARGGFILVGCILKKILNMKEKIFHTVNFRMRDAPMG